MALEKKISFQLFKTLVRGMRDDPLIRIYLIHLCTKMSSEKFARIKPSGSKKKLLKVLSGFEQSSFSLGCWSVLYRFVLELQNLLIWISIQKCNPWNILNLYFRKSSIRLLYYLSSYNCVGKVYYLTQSVHGKKKIRFGSNAYNSISEPDVIWNSSKNLCEYYKF